MGILDSLKKAFMGEQKSQHDHHDPLAHQPQVDPKQSYIAGLEADRALKDRYFRQDPHSPIQNRPNFAGLDYYPPDRAFRYLLPLQPAENPETLQLQTNTGDEQTYYRIGTIEFEVEGQPARLAVYESAEHGGLFLPFRDATSGRETYGAGRYLEPHDLGDGNLLVDFNLSYNPFCAYSDDYSCPLPPFENTVGFPIRAGEKDYKK